MADAVVRGGTVISPEGQQRADISIEDGRVTEVGVDLAGAPDEIDARGLSCCRR